MMYSDDVTEAEYLSEHFDGSDYPDSSTHIKGRACHNTRKGIKLVDNTNRYRCLIAGCNPVLYGEDQAHEHKESTGHRTAKWPVRSAAGRAKERQRQKSGYYDKYNVGAKSYEVREKHI